MFISTDRQRGVTLIELIVFIVIVSVGVAGVLSSLNVSVRGSADPLLAKQALAIAEGLLEEIMAKNYTDPDGTSTGETRATYDDVDDFKAADVSVDLLGNSFTASGYTPSVTITDITDLGPAGNQVNAKKITVSVSYSSGSVSLTGYRSSY